MNRDQVELIEAADTGAPILLITGMPGAGKTNFALSNYAVGKRDVYQCNIPECKLPGFDPFTWPDLLPTIPVDSTLIFDECREVFPPKSPTSEPPLHYVLNRIRHTGRRVVLIAQHPSDIDARVRRLCSRHVHLVEAFGGGAAKTYEWRGRVGDPDSRADAIVGEYGHDKRVFKLYKSTEMHRGTSKAPWRVRMIKPLIGLAVLLMCAGLWWTWHSMNALAHVDGPVSPLTGPAVTTRSESSTGGRVLTTAQFVDSFEPRVPGLAYTATRYDQVTKVVRAPIPAACVSSVSQGCKCYTQQGTPLVVPGAMCSDIVAHGMFVDFNPDADVSRQRNAAPGVQLAAADASHGGAGSLGGSRGAGQSPESTRSGGNAIEAPNAPGPRGRKP